MGMPKNYNVVHNFATRVSVSARRQSQRWGWIFVGFLRELCRWQQWKWVLKQWRQPLTKSTPGQRKLLCRCLSSRTQGPSTPLFLPWTMTDLHWFILYELIRVCTVYYHFFSEIGSVRINRVYELLEIIQYNVSCRKEARLINWSNGLLNEWFTNPLKEWLYTWLPQVL